MVIIETTNGALEPTKVAEYWKDRTMKLQHDLRLREKQLQDQAAQESAASDNINSTVEAARIKELMKELKVVNKELTTAKAYVSGITERSVLYS